MANALYDKGRQGFLEGSIHFDADTIKAVLIDEALYTVDLANHEFLSSVPALARVGAPQTLTSKTVTNGVADAGDITFPAVPLHDPVEAILIYKDTGAEGTSRLVAYINAATGLPVTPNGGDITVQWDNGANKIFKL